MILLKSFYVDTTKGVDLLKIVHEVRRTVKEANAEAGMVTVVVPNPGAGLLVLDSLENLETAKKNLEVLLTNGQISLTLPKSLVLPLEKGKMSIEPWQEVFLVDYETAAKRREFRVQVSSEAPQAPSKGAPGQAAGGGGRP